MKKVIEKFTQWKGEHPDDSYQYDSIFDFVDGKLTRGELLGVFEWLEKNFKLEKDTHEV